MAGGLSIRGAMMRRYLLAAAVLATIPATSGGYSIAPLDAMHERFTWLSEQCATSRVVPAGGRIRCPIDDITIHASVNSVSAKPGSQTPIEEAVRWSDDPGRATLSLGDTAGYLLQLRTCDDQVRDKDRFVSIYRAGVMCSGHYGRLGFFHSMMSIDDAALVAAAPNGDLAASARAQQNTRGKILAWAAFSYRVAKGDIAPDEKFCTAVSKDAVLATAFDDGANCREADAGWTVRRFFTFSCANPKLGKSCGTAKDISDAAVRLAALGALLHMIQDSYAQGHVRRLDQPARDIRTNKLAPVIVCDPPKEYYYYNNANRDDGHAAADAEPTMRLCGPTAAIDDPVSAGATLMWMLRAKRPAVQFMTYLAKRVFPPAAR
jgi:hypothetical protein